MQTSRPKDVREIFQTSLGWYRRNFLPLMGLSACFLLPYSIISVYVRTHFTLITSAQLQQLMTDVQSAGSGSTTTGALLGAFPPGTEIWYSVLAFVYVFIVFPPYLGAVAHLIGQSKREDKKGLVSGAANAAFARFWPNLGTMVLLAVIYLIATVVYTFLLSLIVGLLSSVIQILGAIVGIVGTLVFIVAVVWFFVRASFTPIVVTTQGLMFFRAIRETFRVTRHQTGRLLGFYVALLLSTFVIQTIASVILDVFFQSPGSQLFVSLLISLLITPFMLCSMAWMYQDIRIRNID